MKVCLCPPIKLILDYANHVLEPRKIGGTEITSVTLKPVNEDNVMEYVAATLRRPRADIYTLGAAIHSKTAGNPFYMREMLDACHRKQCIWYDYRECGWLYDLDRIFKQFKTENYDDALHDDLVTRRLKELPAASRSILVWASMLGASFSFQLVQRLLDSAFTRGQHSRQPKSEVGCPPSQSEQDSVKGLQAAIQASIIVPTQSDDVFRFAQERYIRAAASLQNGDGPLMHFVIAQTLLNYYSLDDKYRNITAASIHQSINMIRSSVAHRHSFRKLLFDCAHTASLGFKYTGWRWRCRSRSSPTWYPDSTHDMELVPADEMTVNGWIWKVQQLTDEIHSYIYCPLSRIFVGGGWSRHHVVEG